MKKYDVVALGELLIDFTDNGLSTQGNRLFEANPGGAPCNMLAMLEKLGAKTAFIGKVGNDFLGRMLKEKITAAGINADRLFLDDKIPTTLAFVGKRPDGDRDFAFFRKPGADMMLTTEEAVASAEIIRSSRLFHFGTLSLTDEPVRSATKKAVDIARDSGLLISFDPNYREPLWHSRNDARKAMEYGFSVCDILKIADNEIEFYTGETDIASGAEMIQQKFAIPVVFATSGAAGSSVFYKNTAVSADGFINPDTIETTGRKIAIGYRITATQRYMIDEVSYRTGNDTIRHLLDRWKNDSPLKAGIYYDQEILSTERSRLLNLLRERGYYKATLDNITFVVDTTYDAQRLSVDVVVDSRNLRVFRINNIYIYPNSTAGLRSNESAFDTTIAPFYDTRGRSIDFQFAKLHIEKDNEWVGKRIDKIDVPLGSQAIMIRRNGKSLAARGKSLIKANDDLILNVPAYYPSGTEEVSEVSVYKGHKWANKTVAELNLPVSQLIIMVIRNGKKFIPNGDTLIKEDDVLLIFNGEEQENAQ